MKPEMKTVAKSAKLANVAYDIRGPVLDKARQMMDEGHKIILLNIELLKKADELDAAWAKVAELEKEIASLKGVTPRKSTKKGRI